MSDDSIRIDTLRVRAARRPAPGLRLSLAGLLRSADLRPPGIPPAAVLIVRRLADPLPGRLAARRRSARVDAAWERAVRDALAVLYRRAARPARGYVPTTAEAVLFADEGEMLACLALDVARGTARARWWWRAILRGMPADLRAGLTGLLCERARAVPAALHHLAAWGQAARVLDTLSSGQALAILSAVARAFEVPGLRVWDGTPTATAGTVEQGRRAGDAGALPAGTPGAQRGTFPAPAPPPWGPGPVPPGMEKTRACLLGVSLSVYRRPALVRGEPFLRALAAWWEEGALSPPTAEPAAHDPHEPDGELPSRVGREPDVPEGLAAGTPPRAAGEPPGPASAPPAEIQGAPVAHRDERAAGPAGRDGSAVDRHVPPRPRPHDEGAGRPAGPGGDDRPLQRPQRPARRVPGDPGLDGPAVPEPAAPMPDEPPHQPLAQPEWGEPVVSRTETALGLDGGQPTALGGVLYLINLMVYLDLPACFEGDWGLESRVGSWGVLELVARGLLAWEDGAARSHERDALWAVLARLDGREPGELPGAALPAGERFRLPAGWFAGIDDGGGGRYRYAARRGRLRVWSEGGYVLVDLPRDDAPPGAQAADVLRRYPVPAAFHLARAAEGRAPLAGPGGPLVAGLNPHPGGWLALVLPAIHLRLRRALDTSGDDAWSVTQSLLLCPARLYVTSTHVDVVMSLDAISLPVRLAGLDRNPGWMADLGRVVSFHFE